MGWRTVLRNIVRKVRHNVCWLTWGHRWTTGSGGITGCCRCGRYKPSWRRTDSAWKARG